MNDHKYELPPAEWIRFRESAIDQGKFDKDFDKDQFEEAIAQAFNLSIIKPELIDIPVFVAAKYLSLCPYCNSMPYITLTYTGDIADFSVSFDRPDHYMVNLNYEYDRVSRSLTEISYERRVIIAQPVAGSDTFLQELEDL